MVYRHNGILLSHKKEQNNAMCSNMDGTRDSHTKWCKLERERQIPYDIIYMCNIIYGANEPILQKRNKLMDMENRLVVAEGEGNKWDGLKVWD